jgi:hypothetical protein
MRRLAFLALLLALCAFSPHRFAGFVGGASPTYQGVCDVIVGGCAVAYDVDRSPTSAYSGPLFQLWNGSSTLNVGQTANHTVDLSTYAAFCGGSMTSTTHYGTAVLVSTTCYYAAFYDAIQGSPNTLVPITINTQYGPNCTGGGPYLCAAPFEIEVATGLPIVDTRVANTNGFYGDYYISGDANSTGVTGGSSPSSVLINEQDQPIAVCCGHFELAHLNSLPDNPNDGYDLGPGVWYGNGLISGNQCGSSTTYCLRMEGGGNPALPLGDYATSQGNRVTIGAWDTVSGGMPIHSYVNGAFLADFSDHVNTDLAIHLGGGGDLSQPAPCFCREMIITNGTMSQADATDAQNNIQSFFSTLTFPPPCGSC